MSLRDKFITLHGRKPVLEALISGEDVAQLHISKKATGEIIQKIKKIGAEKGIKLELVTENRIAALTKSGQHQGVAADVRAQRMQSLSNFLLQRNGRSHKTAVFLLDGIHNPANLGMILRSATAAGIDGIIVPEKGTASINPVAIKASAGTAFKAPILRVDNAANAVKQLGVERFEIFALSSAGDNIFKAHLPERIALVLGNESSGISDEVFRFCHGTLSIPLRNEIESLNVAATAAVACYEIARRAT